MKKALNGFAVVLTLFAVVGLATPVFACGGNKSEKGTTASKTDENKEEKSDKKAESNDDSDSDNKEESPTTS